MVSAWVRRAVTRARSPPASNSPCRSLAYWLAKSMLRAVKGCGHVARMLWLHQDEYGRLERLHRINVALLDRLGVHVDSFGDSTDRLETLA